MRTALSFVFSAFLMMLLVSMLWVIGVVGQKPHIPAQTPEDFDFMFRPKKHNAIDDVYPLYLECHPIAANPVG